MLQQYRCTEPVISHLAGQREEHEGDGLRGLPGDELGGLAVIIIIIIIIIIITMMIITWHSATRATHRPWSSL